MSAISGKLQVEDIAARDHHPFIIPDPGASGTFDVSRGGVIEVTSAGAETRTLPDPTYVGQRLDISFVSDGGNVTITSSSPVNQAANNTITLDDIGEYIALVGAYNATDGFEWKVLGADGADRTTV